MNINLRWLIVPSLLIAASGCPDVKVDNDEIGNAGPVVEFDPGNKIVPFPNNLLLDPMTGKVNLPMSCGEGAATTQTRTLVLNKLDGFGTYETVMTATFSEMFDLTSAMDKVVLYKRAGGGMTVDPATSNPIPVVLVPAMTQRFDADCMNPVIVPQLIMVAGRPLDQKSTYVAAIMKGVKTATGTEFTPSFTWSLVRQKDDPVTLDGEGNVTANNTPLDPTKEEDLATLRGLDLLWKAHAQGMAFLESKSHDRNDVLLAWEFNTQTTTDPLDPAVTDSPAMTVASAAPTVIASLTATLNRSAPPYDQCPAFDAGPPATGDTNVQCYLKIALGGAACGAGCTPAQIYATGSATCAVVGCAAVGEVLGGTFNSRQFMIDTPNAFDTTKPIPGPWSDPVKPAFVKNESIGFIAIVPASPAPATGYPTVVFGHGLGSSKKTVFAIGPQMTAPQAALGFASGFITIAIDFVAHDSRAIRISDDANLGCNGAPDPTVSPQCFAPFLSTNLAATRDGIRQSALDIHGLVEMLKFCGNTACANVATGAGNFHVDPAHIEYLGISLGGIIGSVAVGSKPDFKSAVLNVPGAGWVDILEKTSTRAIKCPLVNGLIDAGILMGEKSNATLTTGLCTTDEWQTQPAYRQFSTIARWILDPADPANFTQRLATMRRFMIQKVMDDAVVPNYATDNEAALTGVAATGATAACAPAAGTFGPTPQVVAPMDTNKFVNYTALAATATCPDATGANQASPGTVYAHSSLLRPVPGNCGVAGHTCTSTTPAIGDGQCTLANGGTNDTCDIASVAKGQLATRRMQTDAITFLILNR